MLTAYDLQILRAIRDLGPDAYGVPIRERVGGSFGRLYVALERLRSAGLTYAYEGEATPERGGRRKLCFVLTPDGALALGKEARP